MGKAGREAPPHREKGIDESLMSTLSPTPLILSLSSFGHVLRWNVKVLPKGIAGNVGLLRGWDNWI